MQLKEYKNSIEESRKILDELGLFINPGAYRISNSFIDAFRSNMPYSKAYKIGLQDLSYHFLLFDESFIQFHIELDDKGLCSARYGFYQNPYQFITYEEYLSSYGINTDEADELFISYYEQFLAEQTLNYRSIHFRYDFSRDQYINSIHPASHIHFGENETFRLPSSIILTPLLFTILVIKQMYLEEWSNNVSKLLDISSKEKGKCNQLKKMGLFGPDEELELYLG